MIAALDAESRHRLNAGDDMGAELAIEQIRRLEAEKQRVPKLVWPFLQFLFFADQDEHVAKGGA